MHCIHVLPHFLYILFVGEAMEKKASADGVTRFQNVAARGKIGIGENFFLYNVTAYPQNGSDQAFPTILSNLRLASCAVGQQLLEAEQICESCGVEEFKYLPPSSVVVHLVLYSFLFVCIACLLQS